MANFVITIGRNFTPPTVGNSSVNLTDNTYVFKLSDFTTDYFDAENDPYKEVVINNLPGVGDIRYSGRVINKGEIFNLNLVNNLTYRLPSNYIINNNILYEFSKGLDSIILEYEAAGYVFTNITEGALTFTKLSDSYITKTVNGIMLPASSLCIQFQVIEDSAKSLISNEANFCLIPTGQVNVETPYINKAPLVEDFSTSIVHGGSLFLSVDYLKTAYSDTENDIPKLIKIISLPSEGNLIINNSSAVINQEIALSQITYESSNNIAAYQINFQYQISDVGSELYSNTATVTVNVQEKLANAPVVNNNSANLIDKVYTFNELSFTDGFTDGDGDSYYEVNIKTIPNVLQLNYLGNAVTTNTKFFASNSSALKFQLQNNYAIYSNVLYAFSKDISKIVDEYNSLGYRLTNNANGRLTFTNADNENDIVFIQGQSVSNSELQFKFSVTDNSELKLESNTATFSLIPLGNINIVPIYVNAPPTVGDNNIKVSYNEVRTFTQADFIENTDPRFSDPEGDVPYELKVLTLPQYGELLFNTTPVTINQIISFDDINLSKFKYAADSSRIDINNTKFNFAVSDSGSKIFVS